ncbi:MAG: DNA cytosine methyltransferase [Rhodospirillaceae bacterium]|nr:DNA cytosine methyltransferase [Rhodospirillaceae bacterium]
MPGAYYNENDPYAADWLENLIADGLIAAGVVDRRSIVDVQPRDVRDFDQCHFFAGAGGWSYALRLAGWDDARAVWTDRAHASRFSATGRRRGFADKRHLWPHWFRLIRECQPATIFGEQVAGAGQWIDQVFADLKVPLRLRGGRSAGLHARARHKLGNDCGLWPTPRAPPARLDRTMQKLVGAEPG